MRGNAKEYTGPDPDLTGPAAVATVLAAADFLFSFSLLRPII